MKKSRRNVVHFANGCTFSAKKGAKVTTDKSEVTCKCCIKKVAILKESLTPNMDAVIETAQPVKAKAARVKCEHCDGEGRKELASWMKKVDYYKGPGALGEPRGRCFDCHGQGTLRAEGNSPKEQYIAQGQRQGWYALTYLNLLYVVVAGTNQTYLYTGKAASTEERAKKAARLYHFTSLRKVNFFTESKKWKNVTDMDKTQWVDLVVNQEATASQ